MMKVWMKCSIAAALAAAALISGGCGGQSGDASGKIKIGVVQIVQHGSLDEANRRLRRCIEGARLWAG